MHSKKTNQDLNPTPYGINFDRANTDDHLILIISVISIAISFFSTIKGLELSQFWFRSLFFLQVIIAVLAVILRIEQGNELGEAYTKKRKCEIDTAFETKFSAQVVNNYFDIGPMTPGFRRLLAIIHENALFTYKNSSEYKKMLGVVTGIFAFILIFIIVYGYHLSNYSLNLLSFVMSSLFLERFLSSIKLSKECASITNECAQIIESWDEKTSYIRVIDVFASYGNLLSSTKVNIDPRIHKKFVDENNEEWNKVFARYYLDNKKRK